MIDRIELKKIEEINFNKNLSKAKEVYQEGCDPKTLYEVLYSDFDVKFIEPYGLRILNQPLNILAPIYRQVIVPIRPITREAFKKLYGITIEEFVTLFKEGRLIPLLSKSYEHYPPDYDILLRTSHIPLASRVTFFFQSLGSKVELDDIKELRKQLASSDFDDELLRSYEKSPNPKEIILDVIEEHLRDLKTFGYEDLCSHIIQTNDPDSIFWLAAWSTHFLTDPFTRGLGGFCNYDKQQVYSAMQKFETRTPIFKYLLYKFSQNVEMYIPEVHNTVRYWDEIEKIEDRETILEALKKIPKYIERGDIEKADKIIKKDLKRITEISKKAAHISYSLKWKPYINFGFSVITPLGMALIHPYVGTILAVGTQAVRQFRKEEYDEILDQISRFLANISMRWEKKISIVPLMLWRIEAR